MQKIPGRVVGWWLDIEDLDWDRDAMIVRLPIDAGDTEVRQEIRIDLGFGSVLRVRVRCPDAGVIALSPMDPN